MQDHLFKLYAKTVLTSYCLVIATAIDQVRLVRQFAAVFCRPYSWQIYKVRASMYLYAGMPIFCRTAEIHVFCTKILTKSEEIISDSMEGP